MSSFVRIIAMPQSTRCLLAVVVFAVSVLFLHTANNAIAEEQMGGVQINVVVENAIAKNVERTKEILGNSFTGARTPLWGWLQFLSVITTLAAFFLLTIGEVRHYLWHNVIKRNFRWLWQITCGPQSFILKLTGYDRADGTKYRFCRCPPGSFRMGSPAKERGHQEDERQHTVTLSRVFWIGETPVTNKLWTEIMRRPPSHNSVEPECEGYNNEYKPVTGKSWYECQIFVKKLNEILDGEANDANGAKIHNVCEADFADRLQRNSFETWFQPDNKWHRYLVSGPPACLGLAAFATYFWVNHCWGASIAVVALLYFIVLFVSAISYMRWMLSHLMHDFLRGMTGLLRYVPLMSPLLPTVNQFPKGFRFALPSEAQWEYACRTQWHTLSPPTAYGHGDNIDAKDGPPPYLATYAQFAGDDSDAVGIHKVSTHVDDRKSPNAWGIYDMHGNVWEWVNDWYSDYSEDDIDRAVVDPTGPVAGEVSKVTGKEVTERVWRGGSCQRTAYSCRSARRQQREPISWAHHSLGFRLVLVHKDNPSNPKIVRLSSPQIRFYYGDSHDIAFDFRKCPAGAFRMGDRDYYQTPDAITPNRKNEVRHSVAFSQEFYIGETTVTIKQWNAVAAEELYGFVKTKNGNDCKPDLTSKLPVTNVSWDDCMRWIVLANEKIQNYLPKEYRDCRFALPTEAQWEYACRADKDKDNFCYGKEEKDTNGMDIVDRKLDGYAVYDQTTGPAPVASKKGNNWLIHDMHGNVWEWCADRYGDYGIIPGEETGAPIMEVDPVGSRDPNVKERVLRGGSFKSEAEDCRSAKRGRAERDKTADDIGFRVVLVNKYSRFFTVFEKLHLERYIDERESAARRAAAAARRVAERRKN